MTKLKKWLINFWISLKKQENNEKNIISINQIIETFIKDIDNEFYTFRKYIIKNRIKTMIN